jgi:hypothetical protein
MKTNIAALCGWLLMLSIALSLISGLTGIIANFWAGIPVWIAALLFMPYIKTAQRKQVILLLLIGGSSLLFGLLNHVDADYLFRALEANQQVVSMLIGVGFLRIFAAANIQSGERLPSGRKALVRTLLGAHLFGSVINMSSVVIIGDRIASQSRLTPVQGLLLVRAFCICAFWSPFFAAMGLTLVSSPGSQLSTLILYGLPISAIAIALSAWEIIRAPGATQMTGYPMAISSLWMPCLLASLVMTAHTIWPAVSVLTFVTLIALSFMLIWLLVQHGRQGLHIFTQHIESGIAGSSGEVVLFAAAALLATGVAAVLSSLQLNLAPTHFGPFEASLTVMILVVLAVTGMHPVTSVSLAGSVLAPAVSDPNLLGLTLLMGWSLGIGLSPFSGIQLSVQSRYDISARALLQLNWRYALIMFGICTSLLWFYSLQIKLI